MTLPVLVLFASLPLAAAIYFLFGRRNRFPDIPGPSGIPLLGNALQLNQQKPNSTLFDWAKQYGGVFKINLFGEDIIVVNCVEGIKEILVSKSEDYAGRPPTFRINYYLDDFDIVFHDIGPRWSLMKKTCMGELKQVYKSKHERQGNQGPFIGAPVPLPLLLGLGNCFTPSLDPPLQNAIVKIGENLQKLEDLTMDIIDDLSNDLLTLKGESVDLRDRLHAAVAYVTFSLTHGRKMTKSELEEFLYIDQETCELSSPTGSGAELDLFPWLRFLPNPTFAKMRKLKPRVVEFNRTQLRISMAEYRMNGITCAVDGLLRERQRYLADHNRPEITLGNIDGAARDLLVAGTLTTSSALYYMVALLASHQQTQKEAFDYIFNVIGDRRVTLKDRASLPFIESMIFEMLRLMSHVPVSIPHKTMKNTTLLGYNIPKNTQVWANLWYLHHDATLWNNPWKFQPDRFLDEKRNLVLPDHPLRKQFFAFGAGRRVCAGEALARNRLFIFVVSLLQQFQFLPVDGEVINTDPRTFQLGIVLRPDQYFVRVLKRDA